MSSLGLILSFVSAAGCHERSQESPAPPTVEASEAPAEPASEASVALAAAQTIVAAADREAADREADLSRKPAELLAMLNLRAGMKVAEIGAGTGYTSELLARAVGPSGRVYGQNSPFVLERFARAGWDARLAKPVNANVVSVERSFDDPFPADIEALDLVINVLFYHDFEWQEIDRAAHNADVFAALRPGGTYVIVDASAALGHGAQDSKSLHRIEESLVITELEAAGFELRSRGEFLRNPGDTRDWNAQRWSSPERSARGEFSDKFVLVFTRPAGAP